MEWYGYLLLFMSGCVAGTLNVIAGGGSFLTLPILMFLGLPAGVANGTNRVGILLQNVGAVSSFHRHGVLEPRSLLWAAAPATVGAGFGTWAALWISDEAFRRLLALLIVTLCLWTLWGPRRKKSQMPLSQRSPAWRALLAGGFFLVGVYGGFIQAGVGFFFLAATSAAGLDLVRGNAVKVLSVLCLTVLSLAIFTANGRVDWLLGAVLAAGTTLGGLAGARLTVIKGHAWVRGVVTVTLIVFAVRLWLGG